jgi:TPR repeat protein
MNLQYIDKTISELQTEAERGLAEAQTELGLFLMFGVGVTKNEAAAVKWLKLAAKQGHAEAKCTLHTWKHRKGRVTEAVKFYRKLAEQGSGLGRAQLSIMYGIDGMLERSEVGTEKWFRMAAYRGDSEAQYILGVMYDYGQGGVARDDEEASKWYRTAAEQWDAEVKASLERLLKSHIQE